MTKIFSKINLFASEKQVISKVDYPPTGWRRKKIKSFTRQKFTWLHIAKNRLLIFGMLAKKNDSVKWAFKKKATLLVNRLKERKTKNFGRHKFTWLHNV